MLRHKFLFCEVSIISPRSDKYIDDIQLFLTITLPPHMILVIFQFEDTEIPFVHFMPQQQQQQQQITVLIC